jgi:hypothetical protein
MDGTGKGNSGEPGAKCEVFTAVGTLSRSCLGCDTAALHGVTAQKTSTRKKKKSTSVRDFEQPFH